MKDFEPILGSEEYGSFPVLDHEPEPSPFAKMMRLGSTPPPLNEGLLHSQVALQEIVKNDAYNSLVEGINEFFYLKNLQNEFDIFLKLRREAKGDY